MKLPVRSKTLLLWARIGLCLPLISSQVAFAQARLGVVGAPDVFPIDSSRSNNSSNNSSNNRTSSSSSSSGYQSSSSNVRMNTARVPDEYACPLFENRPHEELLMAIDALSREVKVAEECSDQPAAKAIDQQTKAIRDSVSSLSGTLAITDPNAVNLGQIESTVATAISATQNLGEILNSNAFISSACGRQTMSSGKAILAFNDILNGLSPYALLAVSMNAALAPALPWVVGGVVATSAISVMGKMIDQNTLDMSRPEHRKAVLANTCQYVKVAKKVRFMQLAQSGRIEKITEELELNMKLFNARFSKPSKELSSLLAYKQSIEKNLEPYISQYNQDRAALIDLESQNLADQDDMMICMIGAEMHKLAKGGQFPQTAFENLEKAAATSTRISKIQVATLKSLNINAISKIENLANQAIVDEQAIKSCASASRSWIGGIKHAVQLTHKVITEETSLLERRLNESGEYRIWKAQIDRIKMEELTIKRVEKAMEELAKDTSIIDRSELDQRMRLLKAGLFGRRGSWAFGRPPVLAWLHHTKAAHDQAVSGFIKGYDTLKHSALSLTETSMAMTKGRKIEKIPVKKQLADMTLADKLGTLTLKNLPVGTREHELACQQLETAWIDWSAAVDHLGATQLFCYLIDGVIDAKVDEDISSYCRGARQVNGQIYKKSAIDEAQDLLVKKGFKAQAGNVSRQMKELKCPLPPASVMSDN